MFKPRFGLGRTLCSASLAVCLAFPAVADTQFEIMRDNWGVPHVYADDTFGLYAGFGYAVAQDRLFQMEMARRAVRGETAEVLGADNLPFDIKMRGLADQQEILRQIEALDANERDILRGYAAGFNLWVDKALAEPDTHLPKQFSDFGFEPAHWTELDVAMIYVGTMAGRFSGHSSELANAQALAALQAELGDEKGREIFDQLFWNEDPQSPTTVPAGEQYRREASLGTPDGSRFASLLGEQNIISDDTRPRASNLWIVGPAKTTDGSTILINGPQFGNFNPSYVFSIGLHGAGFDLTGNTPFAVPNVLFGTNGTIAWGATAGPRDVNDYYRLTLNPENPHQYRMGDDWVDMTARVETIRVKGQPDKEMTVWESEYGTVSHFDEASNTAYGFKRAWAGSEIQTLMAWANSTKAQNYEEWLDQAEKVGTTINWYYADRDGNMGYVSPGFVPQRAEGHDERLPAEPGRDEWLGTRPFAETPMTYNPPQGWIANWNNRSAQGGTANYEATPWGTADRVVEIFARLDAKEKLTPEEVWQINREISFLDINARYFLPFIIDAADEVDPQSPRGELVAILRDWDGQQMRSEDGRATTAAVGLFQTWLDVMVADVLLDDGEAIPSVIQYHRVSRTAQALHNALLGEGSGVPQTFDFFNGADAAGRDEIILAALDKAAAQLSKLFGSDTPSDWRIEISQHVFGTDNYMGIPQAGTGETLAIGTAMNRGTENNRVTFRGDSVEFCAVTPPGQSGFVSAAGEKSPHYMDQLDLYENFDCRVQPFTRAEVETAAVSRETISVER
jgi:penicillin amidase